MSETIHIHNELIARCKKGDVKAQYRLYKLYSVAMYNVAMRFMGHQMDAEDIVQESFVQAFQKLGSFKGEATFGAWLRRIVVNKCISQLRKKRIEYVEVDENVLEQEELKVDEDINPELVHEAIKKLPEGARTILNLYSIENYKHKEIAKILKISESTSKSQYIRAKQLLCEILKTSVICQ